MFGLRGARKSAYANDSGTSKDFEAPYSRYEGIEPGTPPASKFSRYKRPGSVAELRVKQQPKAPEQPVAETAPQAPATTTVAETQTPAPAPNPMADLYSEAPIPVSLLRRALPRRFEGLKEGLKDHSLRRRATIDVTDVDEIQFKFA